jgi:hypothetical protein
MSVFGIIIIIIIIVVIVVVAVIVVKMHHEHIDWSVPSRTADQWQVSTAFSPYPESMSPVYPATTRFGIVDSNLARPFFGQDPDHRCCPLVMLVAFFAFFSATDAVPCHYY